MERLWFFQDIFWRNFCSSSWSKQQFGGWPSFYWQSGNIGGSMVAIDRRRQGRGKSQKPVFLSLLEHIALLLVCCHHLHDRSSLQSTSLWTLQDIFCLIMISDWKMFCFGSGGPPGLLPYFMKNWVLFITAEDILTATSWSHGVKCARHTLCLVKTYMWHSFLRALPKKTSTKQKKLAPTGRHSFCNSAVTIKLWRWLVANTCRAGLCKMGVRDAS